MLVIYMLLGCMCNYPLDFLLPDEASVSLDIPDLSSDATISRGSSGLTDLIHLMCLHLTIAPLRSLTDLSLMAAVHSLSFFLKI